MVGRLATQRKWLDANPLEKPNTGTLTTLKRHELRLIKDMRLEKADQLFSLYIRTRDGWACKRCHTKYTPPTKALHCSHFMGRRKENTRYMEANCDALCWGCHQYFTAHPAEHYAWQVEQKGQATVDKIRLAAHLYCRKDRKSEAQYWTKRLKEDYNIGNGGQR